MTENSFGIGLCVGGLFVFGGGLFIAALVFGLYRAWKALQVRAERVELETYRRLHVKMVTKYGKEAIVGVPDEQSRPIARFVDAKLVEKIANCATSISAYEDDKGIFNLQFGYDNHVLCVTATYDLYIWAFNEWKLMGGRDKVNELLSQMQPRKALGSGNRPSAKDGNNQRDDHHEGMSVEEAAKYAKKRTKFDKKQRNLPDDFACVQVATDDGQKWVIQQKQDRPE